MGQKSGSASRGLFPGGVHELHAFRVLLALFVVALAWLAGDVTGIQASAPGWAALVAASALAVSLGFTRQRAVTTGRVTGLALADLALIAVAAFMTGGMWSPCTVLLALPVLEAGLSESPRAGIIVGSAAGLTVGLFTALHAHGGVVGGGTAVPSRVAMGVLLALEGGVLVLVGIWASRFQQARRARERELADAYRQLRGAWQEADAIIESVSSGLVMLSGDGIVQHINQSAAVILGVDAAQLRGRHYRIVLSGGVAVFGDCLERALAEGEGSARQEIQIRRADGDVPVGLSTSVIRPEGGTETGVVAIFQDLTRTRQQLEDQRRRETLAVIGEMTAGVTHEIRNTLVPLRGSVEVLRREVPDDSPNAALMDLVVTECDRLNAFIRDLLSFGRERTIRRVALDARDVMRDLAQEIVRHGAFRASHRVVQVAPAHPQWAIGDSDSLRQIFLNVAVNALEAMPDGGTLTLGCEPHAEGHVGLWLRDSGPGIDEATRAHIFEPFFTTKNAGTGLGLPIVARLSERIGATLQVESIPGHGTTVRVVLPAVSDNAQERVA